MLLKSNKYNLAIQTIECALHLLIMTVVSQSKTQSISREVTIIGVAAIDAAQKLHETTICHFANFCDDKELVSSVCETQLN